MPLPAPKKEIDVDHEVEFVKDATGRVTSLVLSQGGQKMNAKKKSR